MNFFHRLKPLERASTLSLILTAACLFAWQNVRAQSTDAATNAAPDTNAPATPATPASGPVEVNSAPMSASTNAAPATPEAPAVEGTTNAATPGPLPPVDLSGATNQAPTSPEGPAGPGEMSNLLKNPAVEDITDQANGSMLEGPPQALPANSSAVQVVTTPAGFWDSLWQHGSPLHAGLTVGESYDDNILISPQKTGSFLTHITPSVDFQQGDQTAPHMNYLNVYFAPTMVLYQDHSQYDRTDYNADLYYQYTWSRLEVGIEQQYQHLTDASLDEGALVNRDIYTTKFNASYIYDDDLTFFGNATQSLNYYPGQTINEWDIDTFGLYQVAPKLLLGAGPRFAFVDIGDAANQTHQDLLFRLKYFPDSKFSIGFDGGAEYLHYQDNTPARIIPIFDANVTYSPREGSTVFISGYRATLDSYNLRGDTIGYTTVQLGGSQEFLRTFKATASVGYNMSDYNTSSGRDNSVASSNSSQNARRNDDYYFAKGALQWNPNTWLQVQASYQWSENQSSFNQFSFSDNQVDLQSSVKF